jgi:adenosine deaminase
MNNELDTWLAAMPKAELHLHIDGSLQAHRLLSLADKNNVELPYSTVEEVEAAYDFENLQSFLDLYYLGASVLIEEDDFYHLMMDYLLKCKQQNVVHTEVMIEPQTYAPNGVTFATMMAGFERAINQAKEKWGQSTLLILSFLRHLSEEDALQTLDSAKPYADRFAAIGLASAEVGNPPEKFVNLYAQARSQGYKAVVHAGEEGPPQFIWDSLRMLYADRIDHGVRCAEDQSLLNSLVEKGTPLTVCPLSNIRLRVFDTMQQHNVLDLLELGVCVTVNSDDPAYFGGYMNENFSALAKDLSMTKAQALRLSENAFQASFLSDQQKQLFLQQLETFSINNTA